jgi:hypothetical protein
VTSSPKEPPESGTDLEALVNDRIAGALQAAISQVGRSEFEKITGLDNQYLSSILNSRDQYLSVSVVTLACQINRTHGDKDPAHSSIAECLKGTTIRMPSTKKIDAPVNPQKQMARQEGLGMAQSGSSPNYGKPFRFLGFSVNTLTIMFAGYLLGGIFLSPLLGWGSCSGFSTSPVSLTPCAGSILGIILGAVGALAYTIYFFVKRLNPLSV